MGLTNSTPTDIENPETKQAVEIFEQHIRLQNQKMTKQRRDIICATLQREDHFSIDNLHQDLLKKKLKTSRATLYRTIDLMVTCHLLSRLSFNGQTLYEKVIGGAHHDHIMCLDCQEIFEFCDHEIERRQDIVCKEHKVHLVRHVHKLYARCIRQGCPKYPRAQA